MEAKPTILIIDDDASLRMGLAATLKRRGYETMTAVAGQDGLEKIKTTPPDLILCDVMMPPPNGFELRRQLSQVPAFAQIPFVFLTARADIEDRINGIGQGADDYIVKPFAPQELVARIEAIFRRVELEQARGREQMKKVADEELGKFKKEVIKNFHFELRTPLANILLSLEAIMAHKFDNIEDQTRFIRTAFLNADRLESLSTDFILLGNLDRGDLNYVRQPFYLETNLFPAIQRRLDWYKAKDIQLITHFAIQGEILAPRKDLTHLIIHLLDNAFKFSPEHGKVEISISSNHAGDTTLQVTDEGPGIPVALREQVFERYFQGSQGDARGYEGLGVGLTLAKSIVEKWGGHLKILDSVKGCTIEMFFPGLKPGELVYGY